MLNVLWSHKPATVRQAPQTHQTNPAGRGDARPSGSALVEVQQTTDTIRKRKQGEK